MKRVGAHVGRVHGLLRTEKKFLKKKNSPENEKSKP